MKNFFIFLAIVFSLFFTGQVKAQVETGEKIDSYKVDLRILDDATVLVKETIKYNFGTNQKHGIYRDIPIAKKSLYEIPLEISRVYVTDENDEKYSSQISKISSGLRIKVGSNDVYLTGIKTYVINYQVDGAFIFTSDSDKLFWNVVGDGWTVPISNISVSIEYPKGVEQNMVKASCYFGSYSSTLNCSDGSYVSGPGGVEKLIYDLPDLKAHQGVTINLYFDKGIISQPPEPNKVLIFFVMFFITFGWIFLPIIVFIFMFIFWYKKGRDPKGKGNIIAQYNAPDGMLPAEMGIVYDEKLDNNDISAEIIYLAVKGYIRIKQIDSKIAFVTGHDYILEQLKPYEDLESKYQKDLLNNIFDQDNHLDREKNKVSGDAIAAVRLSDLKDKAYKWLKGTEDLMYDSVVSKGYFAKSPKSVKSKYSRLLVIMVIIFFAFVFTGAGVVILVLFTFNPLWAVAIIASGLIIMAFGQAMSKRTLKGVLAKEYISGLKLYIDVAEKERIKFHNAPDKNPEKFEELLPYAMIFSLEKQWAKQFEGIYVENPKWYASSSLGTFSAITFSNSLADFSKSSMANISPTNAYAGRGGSGGSSFGGGFSGGGFGGGGGGSW